jgi:hypothetical protein
MRSDMPIDMRKRRERNKNHERSEKSTFCPAKQKNEYTVGAATEANTPAASGGR